VLNESNSKLNPASNDFNKMTVHIVHDLLYLSHSYIERVFNCEHVYNHFVPMASDGEMTKIKVVDLDDFYNFVVRDSFILKSFVIQKFYSKFSYFKIQFLNCSNKVGWRNDQNKSYRSR
jgi:hypothetical protein